MLDYGFSEEMQKASTIKRVAEAKEEEHDLAEQSKDVACGGTGPSPVAGIKHEAQEVVNFPTESMTAENEENEENNENNECLENTAMNLSQ